MGFAHADEASSLELVLRSLFMRQWIMPAALFMTINALTLLALSQCVITTEVVLGVLLK